MTTVLEEMWAALTAYQPQADKACYGYSWAKMCREKTSVAAAHAAAHAAAAAAYAAYADTSVDVYAAARAAAHAAVYAAAHAEAKDGYADYAAGYAQTAINSINLLIKPLKPNSRRTHEDRN